MQFPLFDLSFRLRLGWPPGNSLPGGTVMSEWIRNGVENERAEIDRQQQQDQLQLHREKVRKAKGRQFLDDLTAVVERDMEAHFASAREQQRFRFTRQPSGGFSVSRQQYPASEMTCVLDEPAGQIVARSSSTMFSGAPTRVMNRQLQLEVDHNDNLYIRGLGSLEEVSQALLKPVLFPSSVS